jgi:hypothetical protein
MKPPVLLYCHCQYAQVVPPAVKNAVLKKLADSGQPFEAVPDLCELSARRDPALARIVAGGPVKIAACFPRAVKWLFHSAGAPLAVDRTEIINMRTATAEEAGAALFKPEVTANLPTGKVTLNDAPTAQPSAIP